MGFVLNCYLQKLLCYRPLYFCLCSNVTLKIDLEYITFYYQTCCRNEFHLLRSVKLSLFVFVRHVQVNFQLVNCLVVFQMRQVSNWFCHDFRHHLQQEHGLQIYEGKSHLQCYAWDFSFYLNLMTLVQIIFLYLGHYHLQSLYPDLLHQLQPFY